jgi:putative aldouronate transport system permease protein
MTNKLSLKSKLIYGVLYFCLAVCSFTTLYPLLQVAATSFSSNRAIISGEVFLWPVELNWNSYLLLLKDGGIFKALQNSIIITLAGTALNMLFTLMAAYPLSKRRLWGRGSLLLWITFTMLFNGGLIPHFILIKSLGLMNSYWSLWLLALISTYNMFVMKTYFEGLPDEMEESAWMDGASDLTILWKIVIPLSVPMIAALSLFYAVYWWNSYFNVLIYINSPDKVSLMVKLYQMLQSVADKLNNIEADMYALTEKPTPEGIKAAAIVVTMVPILLVYPFLQKHFVKGVLIGSVKG